jgi:hypothetical protein
MIRLTGASSILAIMLAVSHLVLMYAVPDEVKGESYCLFRVSCIFTLVVYHWFVRWMKS